MQSAQIIIINGTLRVIGAFLLLSRRAHLLTTAKTRRVLVSGGISTFVETVRSPRVAAPLEPCGSCRRAANFRAVASPTTALSTLYHSLDSVGIAHKNSQYFLLRRCRSLIFQHSFSKADWMQRHVAKETKILSERFDLQEWQSII